MGKLISLFIFILVSIIAFMPQCHSEQPGTIPDLVVAEGEGLFDLNLDRFNYDLYKQNRAVTDREDAFHTVHFQAITKDVSSVDGRTSWPSKIALFGENMFPVATDNDNMVITAGLYGKGRIFVSGHEDYVSDGQSDPGLLKMTQNAVQWLAQANKLDGIKLVSATSRSVGKLPATATNVPVSKMDPTATQVYYVAMHTGMSNEDIKKLVDYVNNGGGLMVGGQVWGWIYENGEVNASDNNGNRLLKHFGAIMGSNVISAKALNSDLGLNLFYALKSLSSNQSPPSDVVMKTLSSSGLVLNPKTSKVSEFDTIFNLAFEVYNNYPPTADKAVFCRLTAALLQVVLLKNPTSIKKADDYEKFPGAVPADAIRVSKTLTINGTYTGYPTGFSFGQAGAPLMVSTGLYAAPGEIITVSLEEEFMKTLTENHGIDIQIGVHSDTVYHKPQAPRSPQIVTYNRITLEQQSAAANPWGGLIYVRVRHGAKYPLFKITIRNAVKAPYFVLGVDNLDTWKNEIRNYPAPWGELEAPNQVIFSVPSSKLRNYDDPQDFLSMYRGVMQQYNFLQGFEGDFRFRAERLAVDAEISAGWMHSGYPVMAYQTIAHEIIDPAFARGGKVWGEFHEFGHNAQWHQYTTGATTEAGCNVYAHNINAHVFKADTWFRPKSNDAHLIEWLLGGRKEYEGHVSAMSYVILMERYGFEHWRNMNRYYMENPKDVQGEKYDVFAYVMAKVMGMNVCPYFEFFTYNLTNRTLETCKALPDMPDLLIDRYVPVINNTLTPEGNCPLGWIQHGASCFFIDNKQSLTWDEAETACVSNNNQSHLASCLSQEEAFFMAKYLQENKITAPLHIGIDERNPENVPKYLDGSKLPSLLPWKDSYPRKDNNFCTKIENGLLYDHSCGNRGGFICKTGPTSCGPYVTCPSGWIKFYEHCYWVYYGGLKLDAAIANCASKDSSIIEINSKAEYNFFDELVKRVRWSGQYYWKNYWLGMNITSQWFSQEPLEFTNWCEGADLNANTGAVAAVANSYCWRPVSKNNNEAFVCEKSGINSP